MTLLNLENSALSNLLFYYQALRIVKQTVLPTALVEQTHSETGCAPYYKDGN
jgi:hypothetical protein